MHKELNSIPTDKKTNQPTFLANFLDKRLNSQPTTKKTTIVIKPTKRISSLIRT